MTLNINKQRVLDEFYELIKIPCPSLGEREVADLLKKRLEELGGKVTEDMQAAKALNGTAGNLVADFKGTVEGAPRILLNAHMDCVNPCAGIQIRRYHHFRRRRQGRRGRHSGSPALSERAEPAPRRYPGSLLRQ